MVRECDPDGGSGGSVRVGFEGGGGLVAGLREVMTEGVEAHFLGQMHGFTSEAAPVRFVGGVTGGELDAGGQFQVGGGEPGECMAEGPAVARGGGGEAGLA